MRPPRREERRTDWRNKLLTGRLPFDDRKNRKPALSLVWRSILTDELPCLGLDGEDPATLKPYLRSLSAEARDFLRRLIQKPPDQRTVEDLNQLVEYTSGLHFFKELKAKKKKTATTKDAPLNMMRAARYLKVPKDSAIVQQGEEGSTFYIIISGRVSIHMKEDGEKIDENGTNITQIYGPLVGILGAGKSFGELALLGTAVKGGVRGVRSASVVAQELTELLYQKQTQLENLAADKAAALMTLERQLADARAESERSKTRQRIRAGGDIEEVVPMDSIGPVYSKLASHKKVGKYISSGARFLDVGASTLSALLKQKPLFRLVVFVYVLGVHAFIWLLLQKLQAKALRMEGELNMADDGTLLP